MGGDANPSEVGLNPYSIGIWSATKHYLYVWNTNFSLNPYSIGIWSATFQRGKVG